MPSSDAGSSKVEFGGRPVGGRGFAADWRDGVRQRPGGGTLLKVLALVIGGAFIVLGLALVVLPGPLTIPPLLLGLYVLSLEFTWAEALRVRAAQSGRDAWTKAQAHPVSSALLTVGGLVAAGVVVWAVLHYDLVAKAKDAVGL